MYKHGLLAQFPLYSSARCLPVFYHLRPPKLTVLFFSRLSFLKSEYLLIKGTSLSGKHPTCLLGGLGMRHTLVSMFVLFFFLAAVVSDGRRVFRRTDSLASVDV